MRAEGEPVLLGPAAFVSVVETDESNVIWEGHAAPLTLSWTRAEPEAWGADRPASLRVPTGGKPEGHTAAATGVTIQDLLIREALNPVPPHLRAESPVATVYVADPRDDPHPAASSTRCKNCDGPVHHPKEWRRCPDCLEHLCERCIVMALLEHPRGWCSLCAKRRKLDDFAGKVRSRESAPPPGGAPQDSRPRRL